MFDHFQAVAAAIGSKLRLRSARGAPDGEVGGSTLHFGIHPEHPLSSEVLATMDRIKGQLNELWARVATFNEQHPVDDECMTRVTFYFGQNVQRPEAVNETKTIGVDDKSSVAPKGTE